MINSRNALFWALGILALIVLLVVGYMYFSKTTVVPISNACTMEAKICPDGTSVGRTGPNCEFAACTDATPTPEPEATIAVLNQQIITNGVRIKPLEVLEDSRCPTGVQCVQAGTVRIRALMESGGETQTTTLVLGTAVTFGNKTVSLASVVPAKTASSSTSTTNYRFEFLVRDSGVVDAGTLAGSMTITNICPTGQTGARCTATSGMYTSRTVAVYMADKKTLVSTITPKSDGTFSMSLPNGTYYVAMAKPPAGAGTVTGVPTTTTVRGNQTVNLNIAIDSGNR